MDGHDYEYLVARYLKGHGYTGTKVTKGSGDFGVDIIAHKGGHKYAVQCKYYSNPVSVGAVQEAVAGKAYYGCDAAMVVTNSTFTKAARELARANGVILLEGITKAGVNRRLPKLLRVSLILAYLFVAAAGISAALDATKAQPLWKAVGNMAIVILMVAAPVLAYFGYKGFRRYLKRRKEKPRAQATPAEQIASIQQPVNTQAANTDTLAAYLKLDYGEEALAIAQALSGADRVSVSVIQRRCKFGYTRASKLKDTLIRCGLIVPCGSTQYGWSENAKKSFLQGVEGSKESTYVC